MKWYKDGPLWIFAALAVAALVVSAPATYRVVELYHSDGTAVGVAATVALLVILEAGAVAAKLATLWVRRGSEWLDRFVFAALAINTLSNFVHGGAIAAASGVPWLAAWGGALLYAALLPALIYLMLHLLCARVVELRGMSVEVAEEVAATLRPVAHAAELVAQVQRSLATIVPPPALPAPQVAYPRPEEVRTEPVPAPDFVCAECGTPATPHQVRSYAQHGAWVCKKCGKRH